MAVEHNVVKELAKEVVGEVKSKTPAQLTGRDYRELTLAHAVLNREDEIENLATGIRMLKAYPKSREKRIGMLMDYLHRIDRAGSPLRKMRALDVDDERAPHAAEAAERSLIDELGGDA